MRDQTAVDRLHVEPANEQGKNRASVDSAKDLEEGRRKWFDDVQLENSTELSSLSLYVSTIKIKTPDRGSDNDLIALIKCANDPPRNHNDRKKNLELLEAYLKKVKQKDDDSKNEAAKKASQVEDRRMEKRQGSRIFNTIGSLVPSIKNTFNFVLRVLRGAMTVLEATMFIAGELTFQTHYEVAVKAVMLFITAYESAGELTERIVAMFQKIDEYGREMRTLQDNIKSASMLKAINKLFVSIVAFIVASGSYMQHGTISKMVKFLGGGNDKFDKLLETVREDYAEVTRVMTFAQVMINLSSHGNINRVREDTVTIIQQLSMLNQSLTPDMSRQLQLVYDQSIFQAELHVQSLRSEIFDDSFDPSKELAFNDRERIFLSPKDRWPRHLFKLRSSTTPHVVTSKDTRPLVWISGDLSRRNVSWVSSFCVDLVSYFNQFRNFDTVYLFCKRGAGQRYSPTFLIKGLVTQLLETHALIAMKNSARLSRNRFSDIGTKTSPDSGRLAWQLLEDILRLIETAPEFQGRVILILIDRLDLCVSEENSSVLDHLIPRLQSLSFKISRVQVLITTAKISPHSVPTLRRGSGWLRAYGK
ncbi:uncharacterized protein GGS22DRAFT_165292 [Annulohypoxylon maeteangense]|uniref:uncharacterized protein n=1 Tax=Annulohypoxylon maeteangense TaxID=1927788 RepID=UPI00200762DF|nr:uncharacterized protein GGS22DRAFT_165292 [Annulohypoxylon maeteangense]KAI0884290.1 hypothetical protein GGS22DRAFT_165292 [Annulohypoxylon maeteangense]